MRRETFLVMLVCAAILAGAMVALHFAYANARCMPVGKSGQWICSAPTTPPAAP